MSKDLPPTGTRPETATKTRAQRLQKLNAIFERLGIPCWNIEQLGDVALGEMGILDVVDWEEIGKGRAEILFRVMKPDGQELEIRSRFGGRLIFVIPHLTLVDGDHGPLAVEEDGA